jgi:outer membrane lipoprotein-sorting protein
MTFRLRLLLALVVAVALPLSGCLFRSRKASVLMSTAQLQSATFQELVDKINHGAAQVQTLNATVDIAASTGGSKKGKITDFQEIKGYILVRKPEMLRMIGLFPIVRNRAFDMVSNGDTFKLWVPPKNKFIVGRNDVIKASSKQPLENLRPQHIYDALLLRAVEPKNEIAVLEQDNETITDPKTKKTVLQPDYIIDVIRKTENSWYLSRKIYFSRVDLQPHRQVVYDKNGNVATDATYADFKEYSGVLFPTVIHIFRPQEEYAVTLTMEKLTVNQPMTEEQFALNQPSGSQLVQLDSATANGTATTNGPGH